MGEGTPHQNSGDKTMTWNYDTLKQTAAENKVRVGDLLALAPNNDPFYTGRPSEVAAAQWFADR